MRKIIIASLMFCSFLAFNCGKKDSEQSEPQVDQKLLEEGKTLFVQNCSTCHGVSGAGDGPAGQMLNPKPRNFKAPSSEWKNGNTIEGITKTLNEGIPNSPMIAYKHLGVENLKKIATYVVSLTKN